MSYELLYSEEALADLARMPGDLAMFVETQLNDLALDPMGRSRQSGFPFGEGYRLFHCSREPLTDFEHEYKVNVFFLFHQDEKHLIIEKIGWYPITRI